jgi:hypothetical protein
VYEWIDMFKQCRTSVSDTECLGCLSLATCDDKEEEARAMILKDRGAIRDVASTLDTSKGSAHSVVHDILGFHKVCPWWVPKELTVEHKRNHVDIRSHLLEQYRN